ncbi:hypothetical protein HB780_13585 (plasmid) [Rhizobium lusitanum]|nr:hypothetical protein [Rhizobium lusitanum]QND46634.1 hypothetical protein HB780_13585 [Rhizobium lusitanum]
MFQITNIASGMLAFLNAQVSVFFQRSLFANLAFREDRGIDAAVPGSFSCRCQPLLQQLKQLRLAARDAGKAMAEMHATDKQCVAHVVHRQVRRLLAERQQISNLLF